MRQASVQTHAAAALVNFSRTATPETMTPQLLDEIVKGLVGMLGASRQAYVQHQALSTLAMIATCAGSKFEKFYRPMMTMILAVLKNATTPSQRELRCRAMECGSLIGTSYRLS